MSPPECAESVPAVVSPVALPRITPSRSRFRAGVITGGVLLAVASGLLVVAIMVTL